MTTYPRPRGIPGNKRDSSESHLAVLLCALMLSAPLMALIPSASSDPTVVDNIDDTYSVAWDFDDPANYTLSGTVLSGGRGMLSYENSSMTETTATDFSGGLRINLDTTSATDSLVLADRTVFEGTATFLSSGTGSDSYLSEDRPNDKYGDAVTIRMDSELTKQFRSVLRFDLSTLPVGAIVTNATLSIYQIAGGKAPSFNFSIHALTRSWVEADVSWNKADSTSPWTTPGGDYLSQPFYTGTMVEMVGWFRFDLSNLVSLWVSGQMENNGLIFVPVGASGDALKVFVSSDDSTNTALWPNLVVNYEIQGGQGLYESEVIGPGTDSLFTLASWQNGTYSFRTDEFPGTSLSTKWTWMNDPTLAGGSYNVGVTRPGWLHVVGSTGTQNSYGSIGANFLYQKVTGEFLAETNLADAFTLSNMGGGLLLVENNLSWISVAKIDTGGAGKLQVTVCENGSANPVRNIAWGTPASTYLRMVRNATGVWAYASADGSEWTFLWHHIPSLPLMPKLKIGLFTYCPSTTMPVIDFDYLRVEPLSPPTLQMFVRLGNSTDLGDASWEPWTMPVLPGQSTVLGEAARYLQYRVYLETPYDWFSPRFDEFTFHYERYAPTGTVQTDEFVPSDFSMWLTMTTVQDTSGGSIAYYYSTDGGIGWTYAGTGGSVFIPGGGPRMQIRAVLSVAGLNTLSTPSVDSITVVYVGAIYEFFIDAPSSVTAGEAFAVTVCAKGAGNTTMAHWSGMVSLNALNAAGTADASSELEHTMVAITTGGQVTLPNQKYYVAETIRIQASAGEVYGISGPITVAPGPIARVEVDPTVDTLYEGSTQWFTATATDAYGNVVPGASFSWSITGNIGTLDNMISSTVSLTTGLAPAQGYLNVTSGGVTTSMLINVISELHPPTFVANIPKVYLTEDFGVHRIDLRPYVTDAEDADSELRWYLTGNELTTVSGENRTGVLNITFYSKQDAFGSEFLDLYVVDPEGTVGHTQFTIDIAPVNDRPSIEPIDPLLIHYDIPYVYNFQYYIEDVDNTIDELSLSVDPAAEYHATIAGLSIAFTYNMYYNGTTQIVYVTVTDGLLSDTEPVAITVSDDHVPFKVGELPEVIMYQGDVALRKFCLSEFFMDPDDEVLYFASGFDHITVNITDDDYANFYAPMDWYGEEYVIFSAIDPEGARFEAATKVTVLPRNQPPWIEGVPDLLVRYGVAYELDIARYVGDDDDFDEELVITTNDTHIAVMGTLLSMLYPVSMNGMTVRVNITVGDDELLFDHQEINVTITDNYPPEAEQLPAHTFVEDVPVDYPKLQNLQQYFADEEDGLDIAFTAYSWDEHVNVTAYEVGGIWHIGFATSPNFNGITMFTIRATDSAGAFVEANVELTITPVPDAPVLTVLRSVNATVGVSGAMDVSGWVYDPDVSGSEGISWDITGEGSEYIDISTGMIIYEFPADFLAPDEQERVLELTLWVYDEDHLSDSETLTVRVMRPVVLPGEDDPWMTVLMLVMGGSALGMFMIVMGMRKRPFVIHDMMLVHNDGFLIGRAAEKVEGEIDEHILSGMLTAVLDFVEDSMSPSQDQLKTFGFQHYQVIVKRGELMYSAVVYDGDRPNEFEDKLGDFLEKVEKIYRKRLVKWTGDIDHDFAGIQLLIQAFIKENSKRNNGQRKRAWRIRPGKPKAEAVAK